MWAIDITLDNQKLLSRQSRCQNMDYPKGIWQEHEASARVSFSDCGITSKQQEGTVDVQAKVVYNVPQVTSTATFDL